MSTSQSWDFNKHRCHQHSIRRSPTTRSGWFAPAPAACGPCRSGPPYQLLPKTSPRPCGLGAPKRAPQTFTRRAWTSRAVAAELGDTVPGYRKSACAANLEPSTRPHPESSSEGRRVLERGRRDLLGAALWGEPLAPPTPPSSEAPGSPMRTPVVARPRGAAPQALGPRAGGGVTGPSGA